MVKHAEDFWIVLGTVHIVPRNRVNIKELFDAYIWG